MPRKLRGMFNFSSCGWLCIGFLELDIALKKSLHWKLDDFKIYFFRTDNRVKLLCKTLPYKQECLNGKFLMLSRSFHFPGQRLIPTLLIK